MTHLVMHEAPKVRPVPGIQTGDVLSVDAGQIGWGHHWSSVVRVVLSVLKTIVQLRAVRVDYASFGMNSGEGGCLQRVRMRAPAQAPTSNSSDQINRNTRPTA